MKVFISWSGDMSRQIGEAFRSWLPAVLQAVRPYFTPTDVEKGARWLANISSELQDARVGLFCVTRENVFSPWMMFEAGALSKFVNESHVSVILFGIDKAELSGPLQQFQASLFNKAEVRAVVDMINDQCGEHKLDSKVLDDVYDMWWPRLETSIAGIMTCHNQSQLQTIRSDREMLEEVLELTRVVARYTNKQEESERNLAIARGILAKYAGQTITPGRASLPDLPPGTGFLSALPTPAQMSEKQQSTDESS